MTALFFSICGAVALAAGAWCSLEAWRELAASLNSRGRPFIDVAEDALTFGLLAIVAFAVMVSAVHSLTTVWL